MKAGQDNAIKVICTAEDGTQKVYTVIAKRAAAHDGSTEPTEPPTQPTTVPTTQPTEPSTAPTEPVQPDKTGSSGGIAWWVLLIVGILCLAGGVAGGIFVDKKYLNKK